MADFTIDLCADEDEGVVDLTRDSGRFDAEVQVLSPPKKRKRTSDVEFVKTTSAPAASPSAQEAGDKALAEKLAAARVTLTALDDADAAGDVDAKAAAAQSRAAQRRAARAEARANIDPAVLKAAPKAAGKKSPALRAVSEGKLKQKFESLGLSLYALCLPDPTARDARPSPSRR